MGDEPIPADLTAAPEWATDELDEALVAGAVLPEVVERWQITEDGQAEWAMRKLAALAARADEVRAQARGWRNPIDEWERAELERVERPARFFAAHLERYGLDVRANDPRRATVPLPSGEIATRAPKAPTVTIDDEAALLAWLGEHLPGTLYGEVVKVTTTAQIMPLRRLVSARLADLPFCGHCGESLDVTVLKALTGPHELGREYRHASDGEYDHEASPAPGFEVVWTGADADGTPLVEGLAGQVVPGLSASLAATTVKVNPR